MTHSARFTPVLLRATALDIARRYRDAPTSGISPVLLFSWLAHMNTAHCRDAKLRLAGLHGRVLRLLRRYLKQAGAIQFP